MPTSKRIKGSASAGQKHGGNQDIGHQPEDGKDQMGGHAISEFEICQAAYESEVFLLLPGFNNFQKGLWQ